MESRVREEDGFMLLELVMAMFVLTVAVLALMASYDSAFVSIHKSAQNTAASTLAQNQLELFTAMSYTSLGLDTTELSSVQATNSTYTSDEAGLDNADTATDVTFACGSTTNCLPVQTLTGADHKDYTLETFIRDVPDLSYSGRNERVVTIIVRDPSTSDDTLVAKLSSAFDAGPS